MDKESLTYITAKWFLNYHIFPHSYFQLQKITYMLKVLRVANSDKIFFNLHTHCKKKSSVSNCVIYFGYINAGKSRILGIFFANYGF